MTRKRRPPSGKNPSTPAGCQQIVISSLRMAMPSSPGALGVFEAAVVFSLGLFGVDRAQALTAGLVLHMVQYIPVTVAGLIIFAKSGLNLRKIRESDESIE